MYDIDALEKAWLRFHRKRLLRRALMVLGGLFLVGAPLLFVSLSDTSRTPVRSAGGNTTTPVRTAAAAQVSAPTVGPAAPALNTTVPSLEPEVKKRKPKMIISFTDPALQEAPAAETVSDEEKKVRMQMVDVKNSRIVREIEKRFPDTRDYDDAMYLAKYYYQKKKYRKAKYWAMQANGIDSSQEESWIIFGKAMAKLGHRADALRVLQAYYDRSGSMRVKELIHRIRKGKKF